MASLASSSVMAAAPLVSRSAVTESTSMDAFDFFGDKNNFDPNMFEHVGDLEMITGQQHDGMGALGEDDPIFGDGGLLNGDLSLTEGSNGLLGEDACDASDHNVCHKLGEDAFFLVDSRMPSAAIGQGAPAQRSRSNSLIPLTEDFDLNFDELMGMGESVLPSEAVVIPVPDDFGRRVGCSFAATSAAVANSSVVGGAASAFVSVDAAVQKCGGVDDQQLGALESHHSPPLGSSGQPPKKAAEKKKGVVPKKSKSVSSRPSSRLGRRGSKKRKASGDEKSGFTSPLTFTVACCCKDGKGTKCCRKKARVAKRSKTPGVGQAAASIEATPRSKTPTLSSSETSRNVPVLDMFVQNLAVLVDGNHHMWSDDVGLPERIHRLAMGARQGKLCLDKSGVENVACAPAPKAAPSIGFEGRVCNNKRMTFKKPCLLTAKTCEEVTILSDGRVLLKATNICGDTTFDPKLTPASYRVNTAHIMQSKLSAACKRRVVAPSGDTRLCMDENGLIVDDCDSSTVPPQGLVDEVNLRKECSLTYAALMVMEAMYTCTSHQKDRCNRGNDRVSEFDPAALYAGSNCGVITGNPDGDFGAHVDVGGVTRSATTHSLMQLRSTLTQSLVVYNRSGRGSYWSKAEGVSVAPAIVNGTLLVEARGDRLAAILGWIYSHAGLVDIDAQGSVIACMYHNDNASVLDHRAKPLFFEDGKRRKPVYEDAHFAPLAGPRILCEHCVAREITHVINVATPKSKKDASARKRPRTPGGAEFK